MTDTDIQIKIDAVAGDASKEIKKLTNDIARMNKTIATGGKVNAKNVGQMTRSFKSLTAHVSKLALIYGSFHALISGGVATAKFEQSIKQLGVYSGATAEEIGLLEEKALALGESTIFSATQVAQGMNEMALAGLTADEQLAGIEDVLNLASVGMISLAEASNIAVTAMKSFGLEASDINNITDIIAKGSTISATTITQLGQALAKVGTVAKAYNISLEETVASLGVLADAGRRGSEAGNQLKIVMSRLAGNREAKKWMDELGISMYDANTKGLLPFNKQLEIVKNRLAKLEPQARAIELSKIFGEEAKSSAIALMVSLDDVRLKLEKLREAMSDNFAEKSAKEMMNTLQGSYKSLMSALEGLTLEIGATLIPIMREGMDSITEMVRGMDEESVEEFANAIGVLIETVSTFISVISTVAGSTIKFASENENLMKVLVLLSVAVKTFSIGLGLMASALGTASTKGLAVLAMLKKIRVFMIANPWLLAVVAIGTAYAVIEDRLENINKEHEKSVGLSKKDSKEVDHLVKRVKTYWNETLKGYYMSNEQREKEIKLIGNQINSTEKLLDQGQRESESDEDWLNRKRGMETSLELMGVGLDKIITSKSRDIEKTKLQSIAYKEYGDVSKEVQKNIDKLSAKYTKLSLTATKALDKLRGKHKQLHVDILNLEKEKIEIDRDYYNAKLDIEERFEERFKTLRQTNLDRYKTDHQKNLDFKENLLKQESKAFNEMYSGNTTRAKKYFDQMLTMIDKLHVGSVSSDGKILSSTQAVNAEKLRLTEIVYHATQKMAQDEYIAKKQAHLETIKMKLLEVKLLELQMITQENFIKSIKSMGKAVKENPIIYDDEKTRESFATITEMTNTLKKNVSTIEADIKIAKAQTKVKILQNEINNTKGNINVGANEKRLVTEMRILKNKFVEVPVDVPIGAETEYFEREAEIAKQKVSKKPAIVIVDADIKPAEKDAVKLVKGIGRLKPQTQKVVAETSEAYRNVRLLVSWINLRQPLIHVESDATQVYHNVREAINWINSQVAYIDVYTRYHQSGGGYIPQKLASGGVFTGSGKVAGYDPTDSDSVSAKLTGGEYVIKRQAVDAYGLSILHSINSMSYPKPTGYAGGGQVSGNNESGNSTSPLQPINLNIGGKSFGMMADKDIADAVQRHLEFTGGE